MASVLFLGTLVYPLWINVLLPNIAHQLSASSTRTPFLSHMSAPAMAAVMGKTFTHVSLSSGAKDRLGIGVLDYTVTSSIALTVAPFDGL